MTASERDEHCLLVIDAGNTRVKWAIWDGRLGSQSSASWQQLEQEPGIITGPEKPFSIHVTDVRGHNLAELLARELSGRANEVVTICSERQACGVTNAYDDPGQLGSDRWAALIAVNRISPRPALVVDAGTAATFDLLGPGGRHLGGVICAGYRMSITSLLGQTGKIARVIENTDGQDFSLESTSTGRAIRSGALFSLVSLVEKARLHLEQKFGEECKVYLTGGNAEPIMQHLTRAQWIPDLVLRGLTILAGKTP